MDIKITKINDMIILVLGDDISTRTVSTDEDGLYEELLFKVEKIRSGLITDADEYAKLITGMRIAMNKRKTLEYNEKQEREERLSAETIELAEGNKTPEERLEIADDIKSSDDRFEYDGEGLMYLKGHSVPMPADLVKAIRKSIKKDNYKYTTESLINFWKWAVLNPNPEARIDLFGWFKTGDFSITEDGMIVAYRCVDVKNESKKVDSKLANAVISEYKKARASKKNPSKYGIILKEGSYKRFVLKTHSGYISEDGYQGNLSVLYDNLVDNKSEEFDETVFTDHHTGTMEIRINEEVSMPRLECDERRDESCSRGLHFMSKKYSLRYGEIKLIILINPMNIVAFPRYDNTKGRCCAYMPVAYADTNENGNLETLGNGTFDFDYGNFSKEKLEALIINDSFDDLIEAGEISSEVNIKDFSMIRDEVRDKIKSRVIHA